jgi:hypothetical protein
MSKRFVPNKGQRSVTSPILLLFSGLGLASQRGGRFDKSTNENT